jgi:hypothetical protein
VLVVQGFDPRGPEVLQALGLDEASERERAELEDIRRRSRHKRGEIPQGKPLDARRQHVALKALCGLFARLQQPTPRLRDGSRVDAKAAAMLAEAGVLDVPTPELERHPRAKARRIAKPTPDELRRTGTELGEVKRGEWRSPEDSETPLPAPAGSPATRRNHRRAKEARQQYDAEERRYQHQQKLERKAQAVGNQVTNPAGIKPLPIHEGRKVRRIARDPRAAVEWLRTLPLEMQHMVFFAATNHGKRGRFCETALLRMAFFAFVLMVSEQARPSMRRAGFDRAVEGYCREALAAAFVWNMSTRAPYHANTITALVKDLELVGLVVRESPNHDQDAYKGVTGWALTVYRLPTAEQLVALLVSLGIELPTDVGGSEPGEVGDVGAAAPS